MKVSKKLLQEMIAEELFLVLEATNIEVFAQALGISAAPGMTTDTPEIKKAFRKFASEKHPDRNPADAKIMSDMNNLYNAAKIDPNLDQGARSNGSSTRNEQQPVAPELILRSLEIQKAKATKNSNEVRMIDKEISAIKQKISNPSSTKELEEIGILYNQYNKALDNSRKEPNKTEHAENANKLRTNFREKLIGSSASTTTASQSSTTQTTTSQQTSPKQQTAQTNVRSGPFADLFKTSKDRQPSMATPQTPPPVVTQGSQSAQSLRDRFRPVKGPVTGGGTSGR